MGWVHIVRGLRCVLVSGKLHAQLEPVASFWRQQRPKCAMFWRYFLRLSTPSSNMYSSVVVTHCPSFPVTCIRDELKPNFIDALLLEKEIIILGEMNSNLLKTPSFEVQVLLDTCSELHKTQLIKDPTRVTSQTSSLLDVFMILSSSKVEVAELLISVFATIL